MIAKYWVRQNICMFNNQLNRKQQTVILQLLTIFLTGYVLLIIFSQFYQVAFDKQKAGHRSSAYQVFLIAKTNKNIKQDDYVAFFSKKMEPYFPNGTQVIKVAAAMPGTRVRVNDTVWIDNKPWPNGHLDHLEKLGKTANDFARDEVVPAGKIFVLGTEPKSFDSRYWGYIDDIDIIGKSYPIF